MLDKHKDLIILLILSLLTFVIRFLLISKGPFHMDTLELAINAQKTLDTLTLHYQHAPGYPLTVIIASVFIFLMRLIGISDLFFSVNFMSVVFGSLGIGAFYLFSRQILDRRGALISSLILTFLPLHVSLSTYGMTHPVSVFFHLMGLYFLFLYLQNYKLNRLIFSAIFLGFGATSRLSDGLIIIAVIFLYLIWSFKNSGISKKVIMYRLIFFLISYSIVILLLYLPMFVRVGLSQFKDGISVYYHYHSLRSISYSLKTMVEILSLSGVAISIAGLGYFFVEKNRVLFYFFIIWFISLFAYLGSYNCVDQRHLFLSIIPFLIMQGYFISKFGRKKFLFILIFTFIIINFLKFYPPIQFRHEHNLQKDFAEFVQRNTEPSSYIIAMDEGPFIDYYVKRKILYKAIGLNRKDFVEFFKKVDMLLDKGDAVYIFTSAIYAYDPKKYFVKMLLHNYRLQYIDSHLDEDWNRASIKQRLFLQKLYKLEKKR